MLLAAVVLLWPCCCRLDVKAEVARVQAQLKALERGASLEQLGTDSDETTDSGKYLKNSGLCYTE